MVHGSLLSKVLHTLSIPLLLWSFVFLEGLAGVCGTLFPAFNFELVQKEHKQLVMHHDLTQRQEPTGCAAVPKLVDAPVLQPVPVAKSVSGPFVRMPPLSAVLLSSPRGVLHSTPSFHAPQLAGRTSRVDRDSVSSRSSRSSGSADSSGQSTRKPSSSSSHTTPDLDQRVPMRTGETLELGSAACSWPGESATSNQKPEDALVKAMHTLVQQE